MATAADLQVHSLLLDSAPEDHPADCQLCIELAGKATDVEDPTVSAQDPDLATQLAAALSKVTDLEGQLAGKATDAQLTALNGEIENLKTKVTDAETAKTLAEGAAAAAEQKLADYERAWQEIVDAEAEATRLADVAKDRAKLVSDLGYDDKFVTADRAAAWAELPDAAWDTVLAGLELSKPAAKDVKDQVKAPAGGVVVDGAEVEKELGEIAKDTEGEPPSFKGFLRNREAVGQL